MGEYHTICKIRSQSCKSCPRLSNADFASSSKTTHWMQTVPELLDVKINFPPVLSAISVSLRDIYMECDGLFLPCFPFRAKQELRRCAKCAEGVAKDVLLRIKSNAAKSPNTQNISVIHTTPLCGLTADTATATTTANNIVISILDILHDIISPLLFLSLRCSRWEQRARALAYPFLRSRNGDMNDLPAAILADNASAPLPASPPPP